MMVPASPRILEFSNNCHSPSDGRFCEAMKTQRYSIGIKGKGTESYGHRQAMCGKSVGPGANYCVTHEKQFTKMQIENARRRHKKSLTASLFVPYSERVAEFACHSPSCAPPPGGTGGSIPGAGSGSGPNPQMSGRPHYTQSEHAGMYNTWDEKGRGGSMSGLEQAKRFVKGRETTLKRMATQARQRAGPKSPEEQRAAIEAATPGGVDRRSHARQFNDTVERIRRTHEAALAESRATRASAPLTKNQQIILDRFSKSGSAGATQADAKPLVARGLVERISVKGRGQGNTPQWKLTAKGQAHLNPNATPERAAKWPTAVKFGSTTRRVVGESASGKLWLLESSTPGGKPLPVSKESATEIS